jgi:hypothetical protein
MSVDFDGGNDRFEGNVLPAGAQMTTNVGLETWVRVDADAGSHNLVIAKAGSANTTGYGLLQNSNSPRLQAWIGGVRVFGTFDATPGEWNHLAVVIKGSSDPYEFYVNGARESTASAGSTSAPDSTLFVGGHSTTTGLDGRIDELRIFTFQSGQFDPATDLTLNKAIPEPAALPLLIIGARLVLAPRRR